MVSRGKSESHVINLKQKEESMSNFYVPNSNVVLAKQPSNIDLVYFEKVQELSHTVKLALEEAESYKESITNKQLKNAAEDCISRSC